MLLRQAHYLNLPTGTANIPLILGTLPFSTILNTRYMEGCTDLCSGWRCNATQGRAKKLGKEWRRGESKTYFIFQTYCLRSNQ